MIASLPLVLYVYIFSFWHPFSGTGRVINKYSRWSETWTNAFHPFFHHHQNGPGFSPKYAHQNYSINSWYISQYCSKPVPFMTNNITKPMVTLLTKTIETITEIRAARYIACDDHAYLISKTVLWLAVNLHQLFSNGAAFNRQSRRSLMSYASAI